MASVRLRNLGNSRNKFESEVFKKKNWMKTEKKTNVHKKCINKYKKRGAEEIKYKGNLFKITGGIFAVEGADMFNIWKCIEQSAFLKPLRLRSKEVRF
jgi:hypothetical protein